MSSEQAQPSFSLEAQSAPPPEIESTLSRLSAYRNVRGVMVLSRSSSSTSPSPSHAGATTTTAGAVGGIVQNTGGVFEGEGGRKYARAVESIVSSVTGAVNEVDEGDDLKFMRIRTRKHELIITPDDKYLLVVLQDPGQ